MEYQMTIRTKISNLNDKQASILLMVGCIEALQEGLDLTTYMSLEYLYSFLTRNYRLDPMEIKDERYRKSSLLGNLVLSSFRGEWLDLKEKIRIQEKDVYEAVKASGWLPNKRTFNSWKATYTLDGWLEFRIVPLDHILKRSDQFEPYSSYTKSYSESAQPARQKTKHSAELDGEPWSEPELPEIHPDEASSYNTILNAIQVSKEQRRQKEE
jgi:hypothetical protein